MLLMLLSLKFSMELLRECKNKAKKKICVFPVTSPKKLG